MGQLSLKKRLAKKKEELASKGGNKDFFFLKAGTTRMRLVPVGAEKEFAIEGIYFYLGADIKGVVSPATFNEPCAIMEAYQKLKNSKKEEDREMAEKIKPKKRYFALHYKYRDEKGKEVDTEMGIRLCILPGQLYQDLIDLYLDEESGDMTDPLHGYDVKYKRTGTTQFDTEYSATRCNPTPMAKIFRGKKYDPEVELRKAMPSYEETQEMVEKIIGTSEKKVKKHTKDEKVSTFKKKLKKKPAR